MVDNTSVATKSALVSVQDLFLLDYNCSSARRTFSYFSNLLNISISNYFVPHFELR